LGALSSSVSTCRMGTVSRMGPPTCDPHQRTDNDNDNDFHLVLPPGTRTEVSIMEDHTTIDGASNPNSTTPYSKKFAGVQLFAFK